MMKIICERAVWCLEGNWGTLIRECGLVLCDAQRQTEHDASGENGSTCLAERARKTKRDRPGRPLGWDNETGDESKVAVNGPRFYAAHETLRPMNPTTQR